MYLVTDLEKKVKMYSLNNLSFLMLCKNFENLEINVGGKGEEIFLPFNINNDNNIMI